MSNISCKTLREWMVLVELYIAKNSNQVTNMCKGQFGSLSVHITSGLVAASSLYMVYEGDRMQLPPRAAALRV